MHALMIEHTRNRRRRSLRKDLGSIVGLSMGLILIPVLRSYFLYGWAATEPTASVAVKLSLAVIAVYLFLLRLKGSIHL